MEDIEDTQDFYEGALYDVFLLDSGDHSSNNEVDESVAEGGYKSDNNSSPLLHVDIT